MIYGIFSGEYSDWDTHGYFDNKEDAEKYCAHKNFGLKYDRHYFIELPNIKFEESATEGRVLKRRFDCVLSIKKGTWATEQDTCYYGEDRQNELTVNEGNYAEFTITAKNKDLALKIARDLYAEFSTQKENWDLKFAVEYMNQKIKARAF